MTYYDCGQVQNLIDRYTKEGGQTFQMREGILGYGDLMLYDESGKLRTFIVHEVFQSCWSSVHTIRGYNKMPKKYRNMLDTASENSEHLGREIAPLFCAKWHNIHISFSFRFYIQIYFVFRFHFISEYEMAKYLVLLLQSKREYAIIW